LIVAHIEKYVCPTITSDQILGGQPRSDSPPITRPHVAMVIAEPEYETDEDAHEVCGSSTSGKEFRVSIVYGDEDTNTTLPGLEVLDEADVALISIRRRPLTSR
jgi:hypothetical protein